MEKRPCQQAAISIRAHVGENGIGSFNVLVREKENSYLGFFSVDPEDIIKS
jgi:hypothetical protein